MKYQVLLYYKYVDLSDPDRERDDQRTICESLGLKGRISIGSEGINGTLGGTPEACRSYITYMNAHSRFGGIEYKIDDAEAVPFQKLKVKARPEVVTLEVEADPKHGGKRLSVDEFHQMATRSDVVLFDARNNYESAIGRFKGAVTPDINLFKELPEALHEYEGLKDKTVVTYCTGGIRCEKASALMINQGFKDVYQLDGGIVKYAKKYPDGHWRGKCYVFDERISVAFKDDFEKLGECYRCGDASSEYINCALATCNRHVVMCDTCLEQFETCSDGCTVKLHEIIVL
jgi:UPF0176 protein